MTPPANSDASTSTQLAVERTRLAHDRTLMAWIRTATSMISFGFTMYKFFDYQGEPRPGLRGVITPRLFGSFMICAGLVSLGFATYQSYRTSRQLEQQFGKAPFPLTMVLAAVVSALGLLALGAVVLKG